MMNAVGLVALAVLLGYLLGSIPFGLLLTRAAGLGDIRAIGSGNIGATNVLRTGNKLLAAATLILDALKGTAAVLIASMLADAILASYSSTLRDGWLLDVGPVAPLLPFVGGLAAFLGHLFPVWLGFKGGKGVATYIGVLIGAAWPLAVLFCGIWLAAAFLTRYSSLSAIVAAMAVPALAPVVGLPLAGFLATLMSLLLIAKHNANISRLIAGTEPRIGAKKTA